MDLLGSGAIRILHVDRDPDGLEAVATALEREGGDDAAVTVLTEPSAEAGLERLEEAAVDCVVSGYDLPGMDGLAFFRAAREAHPALPFVLLADGDVAEEAASAGVTGYLPKAAGDGRHAALASLVGNAVGRRRAERRARLAAGGLDPDDLEAAPLERGHEDDAAAGATWRGAGPVPAGARSTPLTGGAASVVRSAAARGREGAPDPGWPFSADARAPSEDVFVVVDPDGEGLRRWNERLTEVTGYDAADLAAMAPADLVAGEDAGRFEAALGAVPESGDTTVEAGLATADGRTVPYEFGMSELAGPDGELLGVLVAGRPAGGDAPASGFARFERILDAMGDGVYVLDEEGQYVHVNDYVTELSGYDRTELLESDPSMLHDEAEIERFEAAIRELLAGEGGGVKTVEAHLETAGGERVSIEVNLTLLPREGGRFRGTVGVVRDVTERKARERELERYERIVEASGDGMYALDAEGHYTFTNRANLDLLGYDEEELLGEHASLVMDEADVERAEGLIRELLDSDDERRGTLEMDVITEEGERITCENHVAVLHDEDGRFRGTVGVVREVTERKQRERELEQYEAIVETVPVGVLVLDEEGTVVSGNGVAAGMFGQERGELVGEPFERLIEEGVVEADVIEKYTDAVRELLSSATDAEQAQYEFDVRVDDERRVYEVRLALRPLDDGEFQGTVGAVRDVTERKEYERERDRYETLLRTMPDTVVVTDTEGRHVELHGHWGWSGYTHEELLGEHVSITTTEEAVERAEEHIVELFENDDIEKVTYDHDIVTKDGEVIPHENHLALLPPDEDGMIPGSLSVLRNITERKARERELRRQNERLEEFASALSHDLRNPLNIAQGELELYRADDDPERLDAIEESHDRMERLIEDVLTLARQGEAVVDPGSIELAPTVEEAWGGVETAEAELRVEYDGSLAADRGQLKRLLENLFRNAVEHGGADVTVRVGALEDGFYVEDDGPGIPEERRETVFEPGYSTDPSGTGFGLAIVREIAEAHGWVVRATEGRDGGARFEVAGVETA